MMLPLLSTILVGLRSVFFVIAVACAVVALLDWLVRTRRLSPFGPVARVFRATVDPLIAPVEKRVVRAGGVPSSAPWWALVVVVVAGIVVLNVLEFTIGQVITLNAATDSGPESVLRLLASWTFEFIRLAILVRVISSWVQLSPYSQWVRWAFAVSDPIIRPLRQIIPPIGMMDITPLIAYFGMVMLQRFFLSVM
ncbi:MAG: hypothetical protein NVS1B4_00890 [Gemmatimonadaceae bacterium]